MMTPDMYRAETYTAGRTMSASEEEKVETVAMMYECVPFFSPFSSFALASSSSQCKLTSSYLR